ncbi:hypothetical protein L914_04055, partial [Phytophthora nicotianae]
NNKHDIRFLRTAETNNEERGISLDGLKNELSFVKLKWAARQKMTPQDKLAAKPQKELEKMDDALKKTKGKLESKAAKAQRKVQSKRESGGTKA